MERVEKKRRKREQTDGNFAFSSSMGEALISDQNQVSVAEKATTSQPVDKNTKLLLKIQPEQ